jgi:EpsI family protein
VSRLPVYIVLAAALMVSSLGASEALRPKVYLADIKPKLVLDKLVPREFGEWREVKSITPTLPDPTVQAILDATYSQTVARAFVDKQGNLVMLSIAYGSDQNSEATAAHRPEFCYRGNGFTITDDGVHGIALKDRTITARRLTGKRDRYVEKISYWVTLDETATLPGIGRKIAQITYGLNGQIADGMLVRVSAPQMPEGESAFDLQERFLRDFFEQVPAEFRSRVFGA